MLRRLSVTPAHPAMVLGAQALVSLAQTVVGIAAALGLAVAAFGVGGALGPRENLPAWLATSGEYTPFGATSQAMSDTWAGASPEPLHLVALAATGLVAGAVAAWRFRWD